MFEDSTFESQGRIKTRSNRWSLAALTVNGSVLAAIIILPLIFPEALPHRYLNLILPAPAAPQQAPQTVQPRAAVFHGRSELTPLGLNVPRVIPIGIYRGPVESIRSIGPAGNIDLGGTGIPGGNVFDGSRPVIVQPQPKPKGPIVVSQGVAAGMLLQKTVPVYPALGRAMRVEGTVVLQAIISKEGAIENLRVESGPSMLQQSALDAVRQWRYRPFLLNGGPVEVETKIRVIFTLGR